EEAKAIANLGRLALQVKDYPQALVKLQQAQDAMSRLGAMHDSQILYQDLYCLFLALGDYAQAEKMATLRERDNSRMGNGELAGRKDESAHVCGGVLQLSCHEESLRSKIQLGKKESDDREMLPEPSSLPLQHEMY
ncbi:MAG: hypothetical protein PHN61_12775, partial [Methanothrix sp.]|nr:hypothetical protein [Methanothrix sp.]